MQNMPRNLNVPQMSMGMSNQGWPMQGIDGMIATGMDQQNQDDNWSNSSRGNGPAVPMALNVEDW